MSNLNSVIELLKGQVQDREDEWRKERQQYQQVILDLKTQLEEQKNINKVLNERLNSIKFAFMPIADNIRSTKKNHHRVKSDTLTFLKNEDRNITPNLTQKKPLLLNFLKELEEQQSESHIKTNYHMTHGKLHHHQRSNSNGQGVFKKQTTITIESDRSLTEREIIVGKDLFEVKGQLRSHLDGVRAIVFEQNIMATASEDCTIKLWSVDQIKSINPTTHVEPINTIRQHLGPIFTMTSFSNPKISQAINFYSGGVDGTIRSYSVDQDIQFSWHAHTDVIWSLKHHPYDHRLLSQSADGSVKMWKSLIPDQFKMNHEMLQNPLANFTFRKSMNGLSTPTAIEWIIKGYENIACGYSDSLQYVIYDVATVRAIQQIRFEQDCVNQSVQPNKLLYNNDLKYLVSGHEDHKIRFCDLNTGKIYKSLICHTDAVTDLCVLQNVYLLASVSHDGSMRTWDIRKFQCLHEIPAHKQKYDEGIHAIQSYGNLVATAGADGIVKIFNYLI